MAPDSSPILRLPTDGDRPPRIAAAVFGPLGGGAVPLYQRVVDRIRDGIAAGAAPTGAQLPTEEELARHFGVSSITIRAALKELADAGLIERRQGRGTFVRQRGARTAEWGLGTVQDLVLTGRLTAPVVLRCAEAPAPAWVRAEIPVPAGGRLFHVRITRNEEGRPLMMTDAWFPPEVAGRLRRPDLAELFSGSPLLLEVVERLTGQTAAEMRQSMTAALATRDVARTLGIGPGHPVLVVNRDNRTADGGLLQLARSHYRTDGVTYAIHLRRG